MGDKRTVTLPDVDPKDIAGNEETVFSSTMSPSEFYQELVASYCATSVVDLSPAQGEFCKACLATRTKVIAVCGTDSHASRLELLLTDHILGELSREGSTFFRPETLEKDTTAGEEGPQEPKTKKKKGSEVSEPKPKASEKKRGRKHKHNGQDQEPEEEEPEKVEKKKPRNGKGKKEDDQEEEENASSEMWRGVYL